MLEALRQLRKSKGVTMKDVATAIGVSEATVSLYERGLRSPSYEILLKLGEYFGVSVDYLLNGHDTVPKEKGQFIKMGPCLEGFFLFDLGFLNFKLRSIDCALSKGDGGIEFPDGILLLDRAELVELNESTDNYLLFKLHELRLKYKDHFTPKEGYHSEDPTENQ